MKTSLFGYIRMFPLGVGLQEFSHLLVLMTLIPFAKQTTYIYNSKTAKIRSCGPKGTH